MEHHRSKFNFSIRSLVFLTIALSIPASPVLSQKDKDIEVRISTDFALEDMRIDLSGGCTVVSVSYKGHDPDCCNCAVNAASLGMTDVKLSDSFKTALNFSFKLAKTLLPLGKAGDAADLVKRYFESNSVEEFLKKVG